MDSTIQVHKRGTLTLPAELRAKYNIEPGDTFHLVDLDGIFVLTPMVPALEGQNAGTMENEEISHDDPDK